MSQAPPVTEAAANVASENTKASSATRDAYRAETVNSLNKQGPLSYNNVVRNDCIKNGNIYVEKY